MKPASKYRGPQSRRSSEARVVEQGLDFSPVLRAPRGRVGELDPELRAGPQQPGVEERGAVIDLDRLGDPAAGQRGAQRGG